MYTTDLFVLPWSCILFARGSLIQKPLVEYFILKALIFHLGQESFAQKCFTLIDEYAPGFSTSVIGYDMLTPPDLEREIGLTGKLAIFFSFFLILNWPYSPKRTYALEIFPGKYIQKVFSRTQS